MFALNYGTPAPGMMPVLTQGVTAFFDQHQRVNDDAPGFEKLSADHPGVIAATRPLP